MIRFSHETLLLLAVLGFMLLLTPIQPYPATTHNAGWLIQPVFAFSSGMGASLVLGQSPPSFITKTAATSQTAMWGPEGVAFDSSGNLWVADFFNDRVLEFTPPFTNGMAAAHVLGQPDFTTGTLNKGTGFTTGACIVGDGTVNQCGLYQPTALAFDGSGNLWVADWANNRVLEFAQASLTTNGAPAAHVLGQSSFATSAAATTQNGLDQPRGLAFDGSGNLWVGDGTNNRVLEFAQASLTTNGAPAAHVLGQPDFTHNTANNNVGFPSASCTTAINPCGLNAPVENSAFDSAGNLWIPDQANRRVLEFKPPFTDGMAASLVLGQSSFTTSTAATTQNGMRGAAEVVFDSYGNLWVTDLGSHRVLEFTCTATSGCSSGNNAAFVLGEPDFTTNSGGVTTQNGMMFPGELVFDSHGNLWVSDENNRVLEFWVNAVTADSSTVALSGSGGGSFASSLTGVTVTISGSTAGASVFIVPQVLSSQSSGVGTLSLSNGKFFDVAISGVATGTAKVCVPDSLADSMTLLQYWNGSAWVTASGITVTGSTVCGNIPVSALQGTNIAAGDPLSSTTIIPEYPLGLPLLAIFMIIAYGLIKRRTRNPKNI